MAFFCLSPKNGALLVALLNLTIGSAIVVEYLLGRLDYMNTLSETVDKYTGNGSEASTTPVNPFITTTTTTSTTPSPDDGSGSEDEECNWICSWVALIEPISFYAAFVFIFSFLVSGVVCGFASMLQTKHRKTFAHLAFLLTAAFLGTTFGNCLMMFVFGTHWLDLTSLFVWGCLVQIYFVLVLIDYYQSSEFQPVAATDMI